mgnify:FL=1|tara:strand:+ start:180 stop:689 length:510 start_codon:yes stop_codon:yes gene_type:complete
MEIIGDKLVTCKCCKNDACYESEFTTQDGPINTWLCMTCGFTTNSTMTKDSEALKQTLELTADLIRDLRQDHDGLSWFPTAITMPDKGMVFPEPMKDKKDWGWTVVKAIPIPEEDQVKFPDPTNPGTFYKNKMDMKNLKRFNKLEFMDAAEDLGMFEKPSTPVYNIDAD